MIKMINDVLNAKWEELATIYDEVKFAQFQELILNAPREELTIQNKNRQALIWQSTIMMSEEIGE